MRDRTLNFLTSMKIECHYNFFTILLSMDKWKCCFLHKLKSALFR